ncbi:unnamed protein product [Effrenium voratum]|uniref:Uncharacterized protein n=1 Tax=Effrenium voratum TaxID=2562239 RepID=A0AA36ND86_9DINO|nr:unnamed protein product [Effrenium voratum]CAJ1399111.1 unnamed protein product [Effrenium voratum]CAJ1451166.1 unnamed protein product [Effrenium voratum]
MNALDIHLPKGFSKSTLYDGLPCVLVPLGQSEEEVTMDPVKGPMVMLLDGSMTHMQLVRGIAGGGQIAEKLWPQMTSTEQTCALHACARKNRYIRERLEDGGQQESGLRGFPK